jgi:hypothetical protein
LLEKKKTDFELTSEAENILQWSNTKGLAYTSLVHPTLEYV